MKCKRLENAHVVVRQLTSCALLSFKIHFPIKSHSFDFLETHPMHKQHIQRSLYERMTAHALTCSECSLVYANERNCSWKAFNAEQLTKLSHFIDKIFPACSKTWRDIVVAKYGQHTDSMRTAVCGVAVLIQSHRSYAVDNQIIIAAQQLA